MTLIQRKVCLMGDFAVGKTSLIRRYVEGRFDERYLTTVGVVLSRKVIERPGSTMNLIIWDLAGGRDFSHSSYLIGAAGAVIVCDLTRPDTLPALSRYTAQLQQVNPSAGFVYVANKVDLTDERAISDAALEAAAADLSSRILLTSAKTGELVEHAFQLLADSLSG